MRRSSFFSSPRSASRSIRCSAPASSRTRRGAASSASSICANPPSSAIAAAPSRRDVRSSHPAAHPPQHRAEALGYAATGPRAGLAVSPLPPGPAEGIAGAPGLHPLAVPWLLLPPLILGGMVLIAQVHPDPKEIGLDLARYYPGLAAS